MLKNTRTTELNSMIAGASPTRGENKSSYAYGEAVADDFALRLLARDYKDGYVDLAISENTGVLGQDFVLPAPNSPAKPNVLPPAVESPAPAKKAAPRKLSLKEELVRAAPVYDQAVACMRQVMATAVKGKVQTRTATESVDAIVSSLERNPDAMLCLPRMRQRDAYTYTHCVNVSVLLAGYALRAGMGRNKAVIYGLAGLFHDLGKSLLPVSLLSARRKLSHTEQTLVTRHPMLGHELLSSLPHVHGEVLKAALEHHERYDGSGYPKGLSGKAISDIGHIAAIADTFDALSSRRPYKGALYPHKTLGIMYQMRKKEFHPEYMERFVRMVGIYPVGSVVELRDGYRGVVTASNYTNPMLPVVTLALDPKGRPMCLHEFDMAKGESSRIARCLPPELSGIDPGQTLGIAARL